MGIHSDYLDVAIGLVVVFFLASLIVSGVNEGIQWLSRGRAKFLWAYLFNLVRNDASEKPRARVRSVGPSDKRPDVVEQADLGASASPEFGSANPDKVVTAVREALAPIDPQGKAAKATKIKSIPAATLAQAWLEVFADVGRSDLARRFKDLADVIASTPNADMTSQKTALEQSLVASAPVDAGDHVIRAASEFAQALQVARSRSDPNARTVAARSAGTQLANAILAVPGAVRGIALETAMQEFALTAMSGADEEKCRALASALSRVFPADMSRRRIEVAIDQLHGSPFYRTLRRQWEAAGQDIDRFRGILEGWIDAEWARLSGLYRQSLRKWLVVFGVVVAVVLNIDSIGLTRDLWRNPEGRAALVAEADSLLSDSAAGAGGGTAGAPESTLRKLRDACELETAKEADATGQGPDQIAAQLARVRSCMTDTIDSLTRLRVVDRALVVSPTAWRDEWDPTFSTRGERWGDWWLHLAGVALTAVALGLGSSFWFDLLKRLTGFRRGTPPET